MIPVPSLLASDNLEKSRFPGRFQSPTEIAWSLWSPGSRQSTVATEGDFQHDCTEAFWSHKPASEQPLLFGATVERSGGYIFHFVIFSTLLVGILLGVIGEAFLAPWVGLKAQAPRVSDEHIAGRGQRKMFRVLGRDVWIYHPGKAANPVTHPLSAVVVLHGSGDSPLGIASATNFENISESAHEPFLTVFPEMAIPRADMWGYGEDLAFFRGLVEMIGKEFLLNHGEVYVCGHSSGGTMALYLQNNLPDLFRGAASVEAGAGHQWLWNQASSGRPTMIIWNHNDPVLKGWDSLLADTIKLLRRHDSTGSGPSFVIDVPLENHSGVRRAEKISWGAVGSTPPTVVISWESINSTHHWPSPKSVLGSFDASVMIWEFFRSTRAYYDFQSHGHVQVDRMSAFVS